MRTNAKVLLLIFPAILIACKVQPSSTTLPPQVTPSISGLEMHQVDPTISQSIRQRMGIFIAANPYSQFDSGSQMLLYLVSSGAFGQAEITLEDGSNYQADVLYAYAMMSSQRVLLAPMLVGLQLPEGRYMYFSQNHALQTNSGVVSMDLDRQAALQDALERLPRGRIFRLLAYGMVTSRGLDWDRCPSIALYPSEICPIGELIEEQYPGQTSSFVLRLADGFPTTWLLVGWVFQEFSPSELVQGTSIDIPLPQMIQSEERKR